MSAPAPPPPPTTTTFRPTKPIMGDLIQTDETKWAVWTGGKPNATWTGLDSSAATHDKTPFQRRFAKDASAFEARCAGLPHLFKKGHNLNQFMKDIKETLEIRGMDTITYLVDPADPTVMRNIISEHTRFTAEYVSTVAATQKKKYDSYDVQNDTAAIQMFKASLDSRLVQQVKNCLKPDMCFLEAWMILITVVQTDSVDKYDKLKQDIKSRTPFLYSGQNITTMAQTTRESCDDLVAASFFEQSLVLTILESFLLADGSEFYKQSLLQLHSKVHSKILDIRYKHHDDQQRAMEADGISYDDICRIADDLYVTDVAKGRWSPAVSNRDSKTPARAFSNLSTVQTLALQQHMTSRQSNRPKKSPTHSSRQAIAPVPPAINPTIAPTDPRATTTAAVPTAQVDRPTGVVSHRLTPTNPHELLTVSRTIGVVSVVVGPPTIPLNSIAVAWARTTRSRSAPNLKPTRFAPMYLPGPPVFPCTRPSEASAPQVHPLNPTPLPLVALSQTRSGTTSAMTPLKTTTMSTQMPCPTKLPTMSMSSMATTLFLHGRWTMMMISLPTIRAPTCSLWMLLLQKPTMMPTPMTLPCLGPMLMIR